jgi:hypothetical protein
MRGPKPPAERMVRCCHCRGEVIVPGAARSASCPLCFKGLMLDDLLVRDSGYSGRLITCGRVRVERQARAVTRTVCASEAVEVLGTLEASVTSHGTVYVASGARMKGDCRADALVVDRGAVIDGGFFRIGPDAMGSAVQSVP